MPQLKFKRFSDVAFLQSIDKPVHLAPLLAPFADYFSRHGLDLAKVRNDAATERRLLEIFTKPNEEMPGDLLETLYVLDDLADESGHDRIHSEIERSGETIAGVNGDLTPGEYAISVYRAKPGLVQACHEKTVHRKTQNYTEFQSANGTRLKFTDVKRRKTALEQGLAEWFDKRLLMENLFLYLYHIGPVEGQSAGHEFVVHHAETVKITPRPNLIRGVQVLRRHVGESATRLAVVRDRQAPSRVSEPKINDLGQFSLRMEKDVR